MWATFNQLWSTFECSSLSSMGCFNQLSSTLGYSGLAIPNKSTAESRTSVCRRSQPIRGRRDAPLRQGRAQGELQGLSMPGMWGFPKFRETLFRSPLYDRDHNALKSILGPLMFGNPQVKTPCRAIFQWLVPQNWGGPVVGVHVVFSCTVSLLLQCIHVYVYIYT